VNTLGKVPRIGEKGSGETASSYASHRGGNSIRDMRINPSAEPAMAIHRAHTRTVPGSAEPLQRELDSICLAYVTSPRLPNSLPDTRLGLPPRTPPRLRNATMITSIVAAIAISQREARRKKAEQEAELLAASQKSVVIVSGATNGLATACVLTQFGFTVTIVDERDVVDVDGEEEELVVLPAMTVELLVKGGRVEPNEKLAAELAKAGSVGVRCIRVPTRMCADKSAESHLSPV
jgi:hypothetical protein